MIELNYPVKYALLPVKARRTNKRGEEFFITECYIVSKTYVMEEHRKYLEDGTYGVNYKVCYPYVAYTDGISKERKTPIDFKNQEHKAVVFYLYDNYEDAVAAKEKWNVLVPEQIVENYKPLEDKISALTNDLTIKGEKINQKKLVK